MTIQGKDQEDEIIILSDETDFFGGLELDEQKKSIDDKVNRNKVNENKNDNNIFLNLDKDKKEIKEESIVQNDLKDSGNFSFDISGQSESLEKEKVGYDLNSIIDGTIGDIKRRREELLGDKKNNINEEDSRNAEIKRLKDEIHTLKVDKSKLDAEIKKIDENIISLGKMKI